MSAEFSSLKICSSPTDLRQFIHTGHLQMEARIVRAKTNFICCKSKKVNFGQVSEIPILHFCASMKRCTQTTRNAKCLKIIDFT